MGQTPGDFHAIPAVPSTVKDRTRRAMDEAALRSSLWITHRNRRRAVLRSPHVPLSESHSLVAARVKRLPGCPTPNKDRYKDRAQAELALIEINAKFGLDKMGTLHPYECECTRWHLGRSASGFKWWWQRWGRKDQRFVAPKPSSHDAEES